MEIRNREIIYITMLVPASYLRLIEESIIGLGPVGVLVLIPNPYSDEVDMSMTILYPYSDEVDMRL